MLCSGRGGNWVRWLIFNLVRDSPKLRYWGTISHILMMLLPDDKFWFISPLLQPSSLVTHLIGSRPLRGALGLSCEQNDVEWWGSLTITGPHSPGDNDARGAGNFSEGRSHLGVLFEGLGPESDIHHVPTPSHLVHLHCPQNLSPARCSSEPVSLPVITLPPGNC